MLVLLLLVGALSGADLRDGDLRLAMDAGSKTHFALPFPQSLPSWKVRQGELRRQILVAAGLWPMGPRPAMAVERERSKDFGSYVVERVRLETLPGFFVGGNLYLRKGERGPGGYPAVLVAHGHWKHGRVHDPRNGSYPVA